jgi:ornithine cyclodeaminase
MSYEAITFDEGDALLSWGGVMDAIEAGHRLPRAEVEDTFLRRHPDTMLSRSAWIDGLGLAVKTATIFPGNAEAGTPTVNGSVGLYSDFDGTLQAIVDFHLVTKWKTAGDSLLAARRLARPDSRTVLIVGAGTVGWSMREAYGSLFGDAHFLVWNRSPDRAEQLARSFPKTEVAIDLESAVVSADIVSCATMSTDPIIHGKWLRPGQHINLIGAFRPDMREADDAALLRSSIFVDSRETTIEHIGELRDPIERGVIDTGAVVADYYDIGSGMIRRTSDDEITLFKNGGGAHLDLMVATHILDRWRENGRT